MVLEEVDVTIHGKPAKITVDTDPSWGKIQEVFERSVTINDKGQSFSWQKFLDLLAQAAITNCTEFDIKNITEFKKLPGSEATKILGEVKKRIPLETYSKNLDLNGQLQIS